MSKHPATCDYTGICWLKCRCGSTAEIVTHAPLQSESSSPQGAVWRHQAGRVRTSIYCLLSATINVLVNNPGFTPHKKLGHLRAGWRPIYNFVSNFSFHGSIYHLRCGVLHIICCCVIWMGIFIGGYIWKGSFVWQVTSDRFFCEALGHQWPNWG